MRIKMQRGSRCNQDQDATRIKMQRGSRCYEDQDATGITCSAQGTPQSFALFTLSSSFLTHIFPVHCCVRWFYNLEHRVYFNQLLLWNHQGAKILGMGLQTMLAWIELDLKTPLQNSACQNPEHRFWSPNLVWTVLAWIEFDLINPQLLFSCKSLLFNFSLSSFPPNSFSSSSKLPSFIDITALIMSSIRCFTLINWFLSAQLEKGFCKNGVNLPKQKISLYKNIKNIRNSSHYGSWDSVCIRMCLLIAIVLYFN